MKKLIAVLALLLVFVASTAMGAGSVTVTRSKGSGDALYVLFTWIGNATGGGQVPSTSSSPSFGETYSGCVFAIETNPGSPAPTDDYDITLTDTDGVDLLGGQGANRDTATSEMVLAKVGSAFACAPTHSAFTFNLSGNIVNSATGTAKIYIYEDGNGN
jgi:hypothetical protein